MKFGLSALVAVVSLGTLASCTELPCGESGACRVGEACSSSSECESGACVVGGTGPSGFGESVCTSRCEETACEEGLVCARFGDVAACVLPCTDNTTTHGLVDDAETRTFCDLGVTYPCSQLAAHPSAACDSCIAYGNAIESPCGFGEFCDLLGTRRCEPLHDVGESCTNREDCTTGNCASSGGVSLPLANVCLVAHGEPCTVETCTSCATTGAGGGSFCHQECEGHEDCPDSHPLCFGSTAEHRFWCRRGCYFNDCPSGYRCVGTDVNTINICLPY